MIVLPSPFSCFHSLSETALSSYPLLFFILPSVQVLIIIYFCPSFPPSRRRPAAFSTPLPLVPVFSHIVNYSKLATNLPAPLQSSPTTNHVDLQPLQEYCFTLIAHRQTHWPSISATLFIKLIRHRQNKQIPALTAVCPNTRHPPPEPAALGFSFRSLLALIAHHQTHRFPFLATVFFRNHCPCQP